MGFTIIPKRKITPEESSSVLLSQALSYLSEVVNTQVTGSGTNLAVHIAGTAVHGANGAVVGTTNLQTLTNKTLTNPTISSASTITGAGTGTNGFVLKNLKNVAYSALSGVEKLIVIDIEGTPYYFAVYPTKA